MMYLSRRQWWILAALDELSLWIWPPRMRARLRQAEANVAELRLRLATEILTSRALEAGHLAGEGPRGKR